MPVNSRAKGKRFELEVARLLRELYPHLTTRRGVQYCGSPDSPDVVGLPGVHLECKHVNALNVGAAMAQAVRDCGESVPVVVHKKDRGDVLVTLRFSDLDTFRRRLNASFAKETA